MGQATVILPRGRGGAVPAALARGSTRPDGGDDMAKAKRYSPRNGPAGPPTASHQPRGNAAEYPPTTTEKVITTNLPNIFSYRSHVFAKKPELVQRYVKATNADV